MKFKVFFLTLLVAGTFAFGLNAVYATYDDPAPGGVGGRNAQTTLEQIFNMLFYGTNIDYPDPDPTGAYDTPTPGPLITYPPARTDEGIYANKVVAATNQYCGGKIMRSNHNCVNNFASIPMIAEAINILKNSAATYTFVQCVAGARSMSYARNRPFTLFTGSALGFCTLNDTNYTYVPNKPSNYSKVVPGTLFIQDIQGSQWGHIGYVTQVNGTQSVTVYEVNWGPGTVKHGRQIPMSDILCWQIPK